MTLDQLLFELRRRRLVLISESELWPSPALTREIVRALRRHHAGLALLIRWSAISVCADRDWHRPYWYHAGRQNYRCEICERIAV